MRTDCVIEWGIVSFLLVATVSILIAMAILIQPVEVIS